ncbi:MAG: GNAT family N-acetyltransferase [Christensenellales bacterium]
MELRYEHSISVDEYTYLRKSVGWNELEKEQALRGIENSAYLISVYDGDKIVAVARTVSDGGYVVLIVDVIVLPQYQGKGIGKIMMQRIMSHIKNSLKAGQKVQVNLMAAKGREGFYSQFGFGTRPNDNEGAGMTQWLTV